MSGTRRMLGCLAAAASSACWTAEPVASATWTMRRWLWPPSRVRCSAAALGARTARRARSAARSPRARRSTTCSTTSRSLSPAPAIIVSWTCASKLSPSSSTAAIPPCAQPVAPSPSAPLAITATLRVSARLSAAVSPAAPEPTISTSALALMRPGLRVDQAQEHVLEVGVAGRARRRSPSPSAAAPRAPGRR